MNEVLELLRQTYEKSLAELGYAHPLTSKIAGVLVQHHGATAAQLRLMQTEVRKQQNVGKPAAPRGMRAVSLKELYADGDKKKAVAPAKAVGRKPSATLMGQASESPRLRPSQNQKAAADEHTGNESLPEGLSIEIDESEVRDLQPGTLAKRFGREKIEAAIIAKGGEPRQGVSERLLAAQYLDMLKNPPPPVAMEIPLREVVALSAGEIAKRFGRRDILNAVSQAGGADYEHLGEVELAQYLKILAEQPAPPAEQPETETRERRPRKPKTEA